MLLSSGKGIACNGNQQQRCLPSEIPRPFKAPSLSFVLPINAPMQSVPFYRERSSTRTTLGSLLVVLLLRCVAMLYAACIPFTCSCLHCLAYYFSS